ncbi:hypothetical protein F4824DRAFT_452398 [Ustulina deusta]|nr:hypothetical protein F4824DRAFT_452398 [Ustulina deusta]
METLQTSLRNTAQRVGIPENHRLIYTTAATAAVALLAYSRHCYVEWLALGEGGVPHSLRGWLMNVAAHLIARRDPRAVPAPYEKAKAATTAIVLSASEEERYGAHARTSFLPGTHALPPRRAHRPTVPATVIPQRQTTATADAAAVSAQNAYLAALAAANPRLLAVKPSALESPRFAALWLAPSAQQVVPGVDAAAAKWLPRGAACGEIAHVHHEGSAHVCLSLVDAAEVVRKGWGERHRMSGVRGILPWGYVLVYAPGQDEAEWEVWRGVVVAAARAVARSAGFEGEIVVPA